MSWAWRGLAGKDGQMGWDDYAKLASLVGSAATGQWYATAPIAASYAGRASGNETLEAAGNIGSVATGIGGLAAGGGGALSAGAEAAKGASAGAEVANAASSGAELAQVGGAAMDTAQSVDAGMKLADVVGTGGDAAGVAGAGAQGADLSTKLSDIASQYGAVGKTAETAETAAKTADAMKTGGTVTDDLAALSNEGGDLDLDKVMNWWKGDSASRQGVDQAVDFIAEYQKAEQQKVNNQAMSFSAMQRGRPFAQNPGTVADAIRGRRQ